MQSSIITKRTRLLIMAVAITLVLSGCGLRTARFQKPDIKDDFCGMIMNFQYCKCAFHNEYCENVGLNSSTANWYVQREYKRYVAYMMEQFENTCRSDGGKIMSHGQCSYCDEPKAWDGDDCSVLTETNEDEGDKETAFKPDGPFNSDCTIKQSEFEGDWRKYSDLEGPMDLNERSWEAQNALKVYDRMNQLKIENFELERDMEIDRQIRLDLRDYREKLVQNQKTNLVKALIRMAYLTYTTVNNGSGAAGSYQKFLTGTNVIARAGGLLSTVKTFVPSGSRLAIDTSTTGGKAINVGISTAIEAMEKLGDPKEVAVKFITESRNASLPSVELSPEEINILRDQHLQKQGIDALLAESYLINSQRRSVLEGNKNEIEQLNAELSQWEAKEQARIKGLLIYECEQAKKNYEE